MKLFVPHQSRIPYQTCVYNALRVFDYSTSPSLSPSHMDNETYAYTNLFELPKAHRAVLEEVGPIVPTLPIQ
jgi:hypothetical protein